MPPLLRRRADFGVSSVTLLKHSGVWGATGGFRGRRGVQMFDRGVPNIGNAISELGFVVLCITEKMYDTDLCLS